MHLTMHSSALGLIATLMWLWKEAVGMTVLVIGGTGVAGSAVVERLQQAGSDVRCMTRYSNKVPDMPSGVKGVVGDLAKPSTLGLAFTGVDSVFMLTPLSQNETDMGLAAVAAAQEAGVQRLVYMSVPMRPGTERIPHFKSKLPVEQAIKDSGIPYTLLRPNNFYQNDYLWCRAAVMSYGVYPQPIGSVGLNRVDVRDVADAAVNALTQAGFEGKDFPLHGPDLLTGEMVALTFSNHLGRQIRYGGDSLEYWAKQAQHMMPEWMVKSLRAMYEYVQQRGMIANASELAQTQAILGHPPRGFDAFVTEIIPLWQSEIDAG